MYRTNKAIVGANAFAHESGIHQDGVLKEKKRMKSLHQNLSEYHQTRLVLGKHSGRHAFKEKLEELDFTVMMKK